MYVQNINIPTLEQIDQEFEIFHNIDMFDLSSEGNKKLE